MGQTTYALTFTVKDNEDVDETLDRIVGKIREGYTSGYMDVCPRWDLRAGRWPR
jgi:hypothetical protein